MSSFCWIVWFNQSAKKKRMGVLDTLNDSVDKDESWTWFWSWEIVFTDLNMSWALILQNIVLVLTKGSFATESLI